MVIYNNKTPLNVLSIFGLNFLSKSKGFTNSQLCFINWTIFFPFLRPNDGTILNKCKDVFTFIVPR